MKHSVFLTDSAAADIVEIWKYIALNDSISIADKIKNRLEEAIQKLSVLPDKGHFPPELERVGIFDYREIHYKPYRIIYSLQKKIIYVIAVIDGRRYLQDILYQRQFRFKRTG
ncbi:MAG: plasmid stabilization protein [Lentisphaerae bacterium GWF2_44_16]|nr:MAG: plasmid stabilization protein [Lentisphaerae bacterium GWF2_44_16]